MNSKICFFGLLHIKNKENKILNFRSGNDKDKVLVYLKNAILLDKQLQYYGHKLILITNKKIYLKKLLKKLNYDLNLRSIKFETLVPKNTHFYSCHFRVDIFKYLSTLKNVYSILLDLDTLILKNPKKFLAIQKKKISLVNDISDNVIPAYGRYEILKKLKILNPKINKVLWFGGDFFAGNNFFYKSLFIKSKFYQKKFVKNIRDLYNQTDELFISASLFDLKYNKNLKIKYANKLGIFNRYWNTNVIHEQKKLNFFKKYTFLHVPADKIFLSNCYEKLKTQQNFHLDYFRYVSNIKNNIRIIVAKILPKRIKDEIKKTFLLNY